MKSIKISDNICCEDIIECIFDLSDQDIIIFKKLRKSKEIRADELAKKLKKDRSTIYRSLQKLTCAGIITKNTKKIKQGGYYHTYKCNEIPEIKKELSKCIDNWYKKMKITIKDLK